MFDRVKATREYEELLIESVANESAAVRAGCMVMAEELRKELDGEAA